MSNSRVFMPFTHERYPDVASWIDATKEPTTMHSSVNDNSTQGCGCDPGAKWVCLQHKSTKADHLNTLMEKVPFDHFPISKQPEVRTFETGATRDSEEGKFDYEGFFSPLVLQRRAEYMHKHRLQSDGKLRDSDNWQKGMGLNVYMKSAWRHFFAWWTQHRKTTHTSYTEEAICALMFNCEGYLHEMLKEKK